MTKATTANTNTEMKQQLEALKKQMQETAMKHAYLTCENLIQNSIYDTEKKSDFIASECATTELIMALLMTLDKEQSQILKELCDEWRYLTNLLLVDAYRKGLRDEFEMPVITEAVREAEDMDYMPLDCLYFHDLSLIDCMGEAEEEEA